MIFQVRIKYYSRNPYIEFKYHCLGFYLFDIDHDKLCVCVCVCGGGGGGGGGDRWYEMNQEL